MIEATIRVSNQGEVERVNDIQCQLSFNGENEVTSISQGQVRELDGGQTLASFSSEHDGVIKYQFNNVTYEGQKGLIDAIGLFVEKVKGGKVSVTY